MTKVGLRKIRPEDIVYFYKWWRDCDLIALTSGNFDPISDSEVEKYFHKMLISKTDYHFMINVNGRVIGHISLNKRRNDYYETQIVIGDKKYWGKGYGPKAIKLLLNRVQKIGINKIYLEVRPENMRAINAYKKVGFVESSIKKYPKNPNQPEMLKMIYQKRQS